ncbi:unnamed protein product [Microthlaspi erraticum]|uniref:Late embryogenesis abundant protein LEA-2 subgroup domain-containing protein n=1 Tax=Microthlaspi erraticum TaxID=1685480 RepID=A0A6D2LLA5_9BRAS|nr:unnamed protein product [Microthlaspi erraticum]CAA7061113.1 unnamed protein product [Microthlaspi erraticum]
MARSNCPHCGLRSQHCRCRREAPASGNANGDDGERAFKLTRTSFCVIFLFFTLLITGLCLSFYLTIVTSLAALGTCHMEVFVDSFSVSNTSTTNANATADWNVSFVAESTGNTCKISLHTIKSSLLRGDKLISESFTTDYFGKLVSGKINESLPYSVFKTVATPDGIGGGVVWDLRVSFVSSFRITGRSRSPGQGFLMVNCGGIPVNFTVDPAGNMKGSLLGHMRPCDYLFRTNYTDASF